MTTTARLALVPRDGFFCKDGKGWHTSASNRGHGLEWPWPSTLLGALRSAWGRGEEARRDTLFSRDDWKTRTASIRLGRTLVVRRQHGAVQWSAGHRTWPAPMDALRLEKRTEMKRLLPAPPLAPTLGRDDAAAREGLLRPALDGGEKPLPSPRWWTDEDFTGWLAGKSVACREPGSSPSLQRRLQVRVGIRPVELTADEGMLFSHDVLETLESKAEWAAGVEVILPDDQPLRMVTLGSDGRLACVEQLPATLFEPTASVLEAFRGGSAGIRLVTVTPTCFQRGWLPDGLSEQGDVYRGRLTGIEGEVILRAAFVPRPLDVSGWDMAAGPTGKARSTSRMVAPGAVYFIERAGGRPFEEADANSLWLAALGARTDEGFGRVVPGVWKESGTR